MGWEVNYATAAKCGRAVGAVSLHESYRNVDTPSLVKIASAIPTSTFLHLFTFFVIIYARVFYVSNTNTTQKKTYQRSMEPNVG